MNNKANFTCPPTGGTEIRYRMPMAGQKMGNRADELWTIRHSSIIPRPSCHVCPLYPGGKRKIVRNIALVYRMKKILDAKTNNMLNIMQVGIL